MFRFVVIYWYSNDISSSSSEKYSLRSFLNKCLRLAAKSTGLGIDCDLQIQILT
jgi:hypothetical protein